MEAKTCRACKQCLPLSEFYKDRTRPDGHNYLCKTCFRKIQKKRSQPPPEIKAAYQRKYYQSEKGKETVKRCVKKWQTSEKGRAKIKAADQRERDALHDNYIKQSIAKGRFSTKLITEEMVELRRIHLQIKRELKDKS